MTSKTNDTRAYAGHNSGEGAAADPLAERLREARNDIPRFYNAAVSDIGQLTRQIGKALDMTNELGGKVSDLVPLYRRARDAADAIAETMKMFAALVEKLNKVVVPEAFERDGCSTFTSDEGDRVTITQKLFASIPAANREAAYAWLRNNGHGELITETVNASTLSAFAKELLEDKGLDLPDNIFTVAPVAQTSLTRGGKVKKPAKPKVK